MPKYQEFAFGDDLPKENPWQDDRLGFAPFAKRLSRVIAEIDVPNGYVIGLHGEWGSGKSTVLNFVRHYLKKHNDESSDDSKTVTMVDFRPWIIAGHQDLVAGFFKILAESLQSKSSGWRKRFRFAAQYVDDASDRLIAAAATVAVTIDPSGGLTSGIAANIAKRSVKVATDRFLEEPSLQKAYEDLRQQLAKTKQRFLVTIDDLDRLEPAEIKSIMQMVKTVGHLPNVIYLLAYDREIVWKALDADLQRGGPKYAEKIVQQEVELPRPPRTALLRMLDTEVSPMLGPTEDTLRWYDIVSDGIRRWMRNPRDVQRLANALKFSWPALTGEIDPHDLLAMEGLRLFDEEAFNWVRSSRDFLFGGDDYRFLQDEESKEYFARFSATLPENTRSQIIGLLAALFPGKASVMGNKHRARESYPDMRSRRGIGTKPGYDTYFALHPPADTIPKSVLDKLIGNFSDKEAIVAIFRVFLEKVDGNENPMIGLLLEELRYKFASRNAPQPTHELIEALFVVSNEIMGVKSTGQLFGFQPRNELSFLLREILEKRTAAENETILLNAFKSSDSLAFLASEYVDRGRELKIFPTDGAPAIEVITRDTFEKLGELLLAKIRNAASTGELVGAPVYWALLKSWRHLAGVDEPKVWLKANIENGRAFFQRLAMSLVAQSISMSGRHYELREEPDAELYDIAQLNRAAKTYLSQNDLVDDERKLLKAIELGTGKILSSSQNRD